MKEQTIIEGNKLIAEFMGDFKLVKEFKPEPDVDITYMWKKTSNKSFGYDTTDWRDYSTDTEYSDRVCYNSSWDWLMPVVEKIEHELGHGIHIFRNSVVIKDNDTISSPSIINHSNNFLRDISKKQAVWLAVVEFIKWYNKCQKEK